MYGSWISLTVVAVILAIRAHFSPFGSNSEKLEYGKRQQAISEDVVRIIRDVSRLATRLLILGQKPWRYLEVVKVDSDDSEITWQVKHSKEVTKEFSYDKQQAQKMPPNPKRITTIVLYREFSIAFDWLVCRCVLVSEWFYDLYS